MTYLMPSEMWVGSIDSVSELALVLPRRERGETLLVSKQREDRWVTFLDPGRYQYHGFQISGDGGGRKGLIVPEIRIEVDQTSIFDANFDFKLGSMIREKDGLSILVQTSGAHGFTDERRIQILEGLRCCDDGEAAGYEKWRIVLGEGEHKRVLWEVDLESSERGI